MELRDLVHKTEVLNQIRIELFNEFLNTEPMAWPEIRAKLKLLSTAEVVLNRMATPDE